MKKLLLILFAGMAVTAPAQGMERIKSWLGFAKNSSQQEITSEQKCPICLDNLITNPPDPIITLPCDSKHAFHSDCINTWKAVQLSMNGQATCPYCKKVYSKTLKADLVPSLTYTACMLFATWHTGHIINKLEYSIQEFKQIELDYGHLPDWNQYKDKAKSLTNIAFYLKYALKGSITTILTCTHALVKNKPDHFNPRNIAITSASLLLGYKYMEHYSHIFNYDIPCAHRLAMMLPVAVGYFGASKLLTKTN